MAVDLGRDDLKLRGLVLRASVFPVLLMAVLGAVLVWQILTLRGLAAWVDHTDQVIARIGTITRLMIDHENALRGYLLTGRTDFVTSYAATAKEIDPALHDLELLVSDNREQVVRARRLEALNDEWRAAAGELAQVGGGRPSAAQLAEGTIQRKAILDQVRKESAEFLGTEEQLRGERSARAQRAARVVLLSALPVALLVGMVLAYLARRQMRRVGAVYQRTARAAAVRADLLAESEARFRLFVEGLRDAAMYVLDPSGLVRSWNLGAERIKGYRPEEIIGRDFRVFYTPEDLAAGLPERELAEAAETGEVDSESWRVRKDGTRFWASVTMRALRGADGRLLGYAKLVRDTTERKRADMRRSAQYEVARALAGATSVEEALPPVLAAIGAVLGYEIALGWMVEGDSLRVTGSWSRPSPQAAALLERVGPVRLGRGERLAGTVWSTGAAAWVEDARKSPASIAPCTLQEGFTTSLAFPVTVGVAASREVVIVVQLLARDPRVRDSELLQLAATLGVQIGAYVERQLAEQEARAAARRRAEDLERRVEERTVELTAVNRELEAFSYSVSHDLRAPLRALDGFSQVLIEDYAEQLDATAKDYLGRIRAASQRMSRLIDDLIRLSRVSRAELNRETVDLSALFRDVAGEAQEHEPDRRVDVVVADGVQARGDARLLRAGLANLVGNAFKFTRKQARPCIEFGVEQRGGGRVYYVQDNGAGFDMAHASKLFQPFQRLHSAAEFEGTGIGLATWQRIVHRHGGRVWAESSPGKGARFLFTLGDH